jgi:predicted nuclease with TOPRIM domain
MGDGEVVELLKIANGYLPRIRLEYDRLKSELNSLKSEISNSVRIYQQFCDRNLELKKREDELLLTISELEHKKVELQKTMFNESPSEFEESYIDNDNLNLEVQHEEAILMNECINTPKYGEQ